MYEKNQENSWIILGIKGEKWKVDIFNALIDRKQIKKKKLWRLPQSWLRKFDGKETNCSKFEC